MKNLTLENFTATTGFRFRISREQKARITAGTLTREQAFAEFIKSGGLDDLQKKRRPDIPDEVYLKPGLTVDNFAEHVAAAIGVPRRFRVSREQQARMDSGTLTREAALLETIEQKRRTLTTN